MMVRRMEANPSNSTTGYSPSPLWSDAALTRLIYDLREKNGACGLGDLRKRTGQSRQALDERIKTLEKRGLVRRTRGVPGSIRTTDETVYRKKAE